MTGTQKEFDIIKGAFKGNEHLLQLTQALFLGLELTPEEKDTIRATYASKDLRKVMRNRLLPTFNKEMKVGQLSDVWGGVEEMIFNQPRDTVYQAVMYKASAMEMTEKALNLLEDPDGEPVSTEYNPETLSTDPTGVRLLARNQYVKSIINVLATLWVIAEQGDNEKPEQTAERLQKDSTQ